jgi:hypothetical protein
MSTAGPVGSSVGGGGAGLLDGIDAIVVVGTGVVVGASVMLGAAVVGGGGAAVGGGGAAVVDAATVLVDAVGAAASEIVVGTDGSEAGELSASSRAFRASTIDGDGVGGMMTGCADSVTAAGCGEPTEPGTGGIESTRTGSGSCARHMSQNASDITPITINQNEVGSRGSDHRDRVSCELGRPAFAAGRVGASATEASGTALDPGSGGGATSTGVPDGCGQLSGSCGLWSQTVRVSDTCRT